MNIESRIDILLEKIAGARWRTTDNLLKALRRLEALNPKWLGGLGIDKRLQQKPTRAALLEITSKFLNKTPFNDLKKYVDDLPKPGNIKQLVADPSIAWRGHKIPSPEIGNFKNMGVLHGTPWFDALHMYSSPTAGFPVAFASRYKLSPNQRAYPGTTLEQGWKALNLWRQGGRIKDARRAVANLGENLPETLQPLRPIFKTYETNLRRNPLLQTYIANPNAVNKVDLRVMTPQSKRIFNDLYTQSKARIIPNVVEGNRDAQGLPWRNLYRRFSEDGSQEIRGNRFVKRPLGPSNTQKSLQERLKDYKANSAWRRNIVSAYE